MTAVRSAGTIRISFLLFVVFGLMVSLSAFEAPALDGRVVDRTGLFSKEEKAKLDHALSVFEKATGGQLFLAVLPPPEDVSLEEAGIALMDKWKPGDKGKDNGAVLLVIPETRKIRLEIGYGWEGCVNDAKAGDVIRLMGPYFREDRYADGVLAAVHQLARDITGKDLPEIAPDAPAAGPEEEEIPAWLIIVIVIVFILLCIRFPWLPGFILLSLLSGGGGGRGGGGGGFGGGRGGRGGGGGASGGW